MFTSSIGAQITKSASFFGQVAKEIISKSEDGNQYSKIQIEGLQLSQEIGKPILPVKIVKILAAPNEKITDVNVSLGSAETLYMKNKIMPGQEPLQTGIINEKRKFVQPDKTIYDSDKPYPEKLVQVVNEGYFDGNNHIVTLLIYPMQYYPKSGIIKKYSSVQYSLNSSKNFDSKIFNITRKKETQDIYDDILKKVVDNPEDISLYQKKANLISASVGNSNIINSQSSLLTTTTLPFYEYVIITPSAFSSAFNNFVTWKRRKGVNIGVVTTEQIYANYTGDLISGINDNPGKIRQYLYDGYSSGVTVYSLLAGKSDFVPVRKGASYPTQSSNTITEESNLIPADIYFADFNGDWEYDHDNNIGEPVWNQPQYSLFGDSPDYYPEIFVGRLLCTNVQDISNWTNKIIKYEKNPGNGDYSYLLRAFMHESDEMQDGAEAESVTQYLPLGFSNLIWKEIGTDSDPNTSDAGDLAPNSPYGSQIINQFNQIKYGFWAWFNHGVPVMITTKSSGYNQSNCFPIQSYDNYSFGAPDNNKGLDNLNNVEYPSIVYAISCLVTPLDYYNPNGYWTNMRNMGEAFTVCTQNGGVALLGNSRFGFVGESVKMTRNFLDLVRSSSNNAHLGVAELMSKCTAQITSSENYHYLNYTHNLIGCPEMQMWTYYPAQFDQIDIAMSSNSISVNSYIEGSNICATDMGTGSSFFSVGKNISSYDFNTATRPLYITVSKHNYIPACYKTSFTSSVSGPTSRASGQSGTWSVSVSGGTTAYHYKWYYRHPSASVQSVSKVMLRTILQDFWVEVGGDSTQMTRSDSYSFDVKCVVTDAEGYKSIASFCSVPISNQQSISAENGNKLMEETAQIPVEYSIASFPNPFNPTTVIKYSVTNTENVSIKVYNMLSQEVAVLVNETKSAGTHQVSFNAGNLPSGVYIARIQAGSFSKSIKMQLVK